MKSDFLPISAKGPQSVPNIDRIDRSLLALLQRNNRLTVEELAAKAGASPSAIHRRVKALRDRGIITADVSIIAPEALGLVMTFIVEVILERVRAAEVSAMKRKLLEAPEIQQIYNITGDSDLLLIIPARDVQHFEEISRKLFSSDARIARYRTMLVMERVKVGMALDIADAAPASKLPPSPRKPAQKALRNRN